MAHYSRARKKGVERWDRKVAQKISVRRLAVAKRGRKLFSFFSSYKLQREAGSLEMDELIFCVEIASEYQMK